MDTSHRDAANPVRDDCYYLESVILHVSGQPSELINPISADRLTGRR